MWRTPIVSISLHDEHPGQQFHLSQNWVTELPDIFYVCLFYFDINSSPPDTFMHQETHFDALIPAKQSVYWARSKGDSYQSSTLESIFHKCSQNLPFPFPFQFNPRSQENVYSPTTMLKVGDFQNRVEIPQFLPLWIQVAQGCQRGISSWIKLWWVSGF